MLLLAPSIKTPSYTTIWKQAIPDLIRGTILVGAEEIQKTKKKTPTVPEIRISHLQHKNYKQNEKSRYDLLKPLFLMVL